MAQRILVGTRKGLFAVERGSSGGWEIASVAFEGDNVPITSYDPRDGSTYAALDHGHFGAKLHRSGDAGATWTEVGVPAYPAPAEGDDDMDTTQGAPVPWKLHRIWAIEPGGPNEPGVLWCGTIPGGLFRSADGGQTWGLVETLWKHPDRRKWFGGGADRPGIHSVCVDPRDASRLAIGVSCGGVWASDDAGESWECRAEGMRAEYMPPELSGDPNSQDPHRVVRCPGSPDHLWAQHHNGIFRSTDDSRSWTEVKAEAPSRFGFGVAVHPTNPDVAWFVPGVKDEKRIPVGGKLVVTRTRDGGRSFDVLWKGLPQRHAYDIVYRHALDIDTSGRTLAFGSTTGSVWASDDGGETWQTVSNHLPPVYCVRFAG